MQPKEVHSFVRMLGILADPDKLSSLTTELQDKADQANAALDALQVREAALQDRQNVVQNMADEANAKLALCESHIVDIANGRKANEELAMQLAQLQGQLNSREIDLQNINEEQNNRHQSLKLREHDVIERENAVTDLTAALDQRTALLDSQMAKIKALATEG